MTEESRAGIPQGVNADLNEPASPASFMGSVATKNRSIQTMTQPASTEPWVSIKHIKTVTN